MIHVYTVPKFNIWSYEYNLKYEETVATRGRRLSTVLPFETDVVNEKGVYTNNSLFGLNLFVWGNNSCLGENDLTGHS